MNKMFRFSREITLGDLVLALAFVTPALIWGANAEARLEQHDRAIASIEAQQIEFQKSLSDTAQTLAVVQTRLNFKP